MVSKRILFLLLLICLLLAAQTALSLEIPERPKGRVSDYAGLLTGEQIARLDAKLQMYEEETTNQIAVAIFKNLEGESLEDFSIRLAEQWKVGTRLRDNGVILLIFTEDRELRIEVGYGLEGALTDAISSSIIRNVIVPRFRRGDYYGGIEAGVQKIIEAIKGEYKAEPTTGEGDRRESWFNFVFWAVLILTLILIIWEDGRHRSYTFGPGGWRSGRSFPRRGTFGGGFPRGRGSSGGGFSGGGGGFGGGGASGSW